MQSPQARRLENALDVKLGQFAKLCSGYEQSYSRGESGLATDQVSKKPCVAHAAC